MRRRLQEEETSGEENAPERVSRTRKLQECPEKRFQEEDATGGRCKRRKLPGGGGSRYRGFQEMGAL